MADLKTWEQRVTAWRSSGQSAVEFCDGREFSVHSLRYWRRRLKTGATPPPARASGPAVRLARVIRRRAAVRIPATSGEPTGVVIEVGAARVAVAVGFDRPTLAAVMDVLGVGGSP